jgi:hypothetical protein
MTRSTRSAARRAGCCAMGAGTFSDPAPTGCNLPAAAVRPADPVVQTPTVAGPAKLADVSPTVAHFCGDSV